MEPIRDLLRLRRAQGGSLRIQPAAIAGDCGDFRVSLEPLRKAFGSPVRQQVQNAVQIQVDENRSILLPFAPRPIIYAEVAHWRTVLLSSLLPDPAQYGVVTGSHGESCKNALARTAAGHIPDQAHDLCCSFRLSGIGASNARQTLTEDLARTRWTPASKAADRCP